MREIKIPKLTCEGCKGRDRINRALAEKVDRLERERKTFEMMAQGIKLVVDNTGRKNGTPAR